MTPEIERLAKEAGASVEKWMTLPPKTSQYHFTPEELEKFAALIAESCAKECDEWRRYAGGGGAHIDLCSKSIRYKFALSGKDGS